MNALPRRRHDVGWSAHASLAARGTAGFLKERVFKLWAPLLALGAAAIVSPRAAHGATPVGRWYAEGGAAQVEISPCGAGLCGRVVWLRSPFDEDGCDWRDRRNPDPTRRDQPIVGLQILAGLQPADDARSWTGGTVYDPTSGRTYRCTLELDSDDRARVRGYIGVPLLGRTTTWIRVGTENQMCNQRNSESRPAGL
jgi:uncharacterized protein (DUF2147 family)